MPTGTMDDSDGGPLNPSANVAKAKPAGYSRDHRPQSALHAAPKPQPTTKLAIAGPVHQARLRA